jgi:PAS domain S-box-containing protein
LPKDLLSGSGGKTSLASERFELLVEAITDYAIYMLEPDGTVATWNAGARRLNGYTDQEILGRHFAQFFTPEDRAIDKPGTALRTAAETGRWEDEGWCVRKDGQRFWASRCSTRSMTEPAN